MTQDRKREDAWLKELLSEPDIADEGFSQKVIIRVKRYFWIRRGLFWSALITSLLLVFLFLKSVFHLFQSHLFQLETHHLLVVLVSLGFFGIIWLESESRSLPPLPEPHRQS